MEATTALQDILSKAECEAIRSCPFDDEKEGMSDEADSLGEEPIQVARIHMIEATEEEQTLPLARVEGNPSDYESESQDSNHHPPTHLVETDWWPILSEIDSKVEFCITRIEEWDDWEPPVVKRDIFDILDDLGNMKKEIGKTFTAIMDQEQQQREKLCEEVAYLRKKIEDLQLQIAAGVRSEATAQTTCHSCLQLQEQVQHTLENIAAKETKFGKDLYNFVQCESRDNWFNNFRATCLSHCMD